MREGGAWAVVVGSALVGSLMDRSSTGTDKGLAALAYGTLGCPPGMGASSLAGAFRDEEAIPIG